VQCAPSWRRELHKRSGLAWPTCDAETVTEVAIRRTAELSPAELRAIRALLDAAFEGRFSDDDWHHALGGVHALVREADTPVAHASVVPRTLIAGDRPLAVGYVEGVATRPDRRRRGYANRAMEAIDGIIAADFDLGALSTGVPGLYARLGWESWRGPTYVDAPQGRLRTADEDDGIMVLRTARSSDLDLTSELVCDWRPGDVW
jgi:aminoglycoside 2'-N-acetyltransferase I